MTGICSWGEWMLGLGAGWTSGFFDVFIHSGCWVINIGIRFMTNTSICQIATGNSLS